MSIDDWRSQIKRGTLEFCILLMISQKPRYGYEIINELEGWPILAAKESTVYPLLRRLMKDEFLTSFWKETTEGLPPRKYYFHYRDGQAVFSRHVGGVGQSAGGHRRNQRRDRVWTRHWKTILKGLRTT